VLGKFGVFLTS